MKPARCAGPSTTGFAGGPPPRDKLGEDFPENFTPTSTKNTDQYKKPLTQRSTISIPVSIEMREVAEAREWDWGPAPTLQQH